MISFSKAVRNKFSVGEYYTPSNIQKTLDGVILKNIKVLHVQEVGIYYVKFKIIKLNSTSAVYRRNYCRHYWNNDEITVSFSMYKQLDVLLKCDISGYTLLESPSNISKTNESHNNYSVTF